MTDTAATQLRRLRLQRGHSIRKLSGLSGVAVGTIRRIEDGTAKPFEHTLISLARALDADPAQLGVDIPAEAVNE